MLKVPRTLTAALLLSSSLSILLSSSPSASAATVIATGSNPRICDQTVGNNSGVTAYRISGGDCVVEFKSVGTTSWTSPALMGNLSILVVGGGGGGGSRHAGGGGAGGILYVTNYKASANTSYEIKVGDGGAGAVGGANSGGGRNGAASNFGGFSGSSSLIANGGGGGQGGGNIANSLEFDGSTINPVQARGSGGGSNYDTEAPGNPAPGVAADVSRANGVTNMTVNAVVATVNAYGYAGGVGRGAGNCTGATGAQGWCGGGGGGATGPGSTGTFVSGSLYRAGAGGIGVTLAITGNSVAYGGGGGGGSGSNASFNNNIDCVNASATEGSGGNGGGGAGGRCLSGASSGSANTGGGGGGGGLAYLTTTSDGQGAGGKGGSGIVVIRYTPDSVAPTYSNSTTFSIAENSLVATNAATITVNESSTITIDSGVDRLLFTVIFASSTSSHIRFLASPNFESPTDSGINNVYNITVRATDLAGNTADQSVSITVTNVNEAPMITNNSSAATYALSQAEISAVGVDFDASDIDAGAMLSFAISGTDATDFSINSESGQFLFITAPDFEAPVDADRNNSYLVVVSVSDGALTDSQTVTITITNSNESGALGAPSLSGVAYKGNSVTISVTSNSPGKVRFFAGGKRISSCLSRSIIGSYPNQSATCIWKPTVTGATFLTATLSPSDGTYSPATSPRIDVRVFKRTNTR